MDESEFTGTLHKLYYKYVGNTSTMSNCEKRAEYMMPNIDKFYELLIDKKLQCIYNYPKKADPKYYHIVASEIYNSFDYSRKDDCNRCGEQFGQRYKCKECSDYWCKHDTSHRNHYANCRVGCLANLLGTYDSGYGNMYGRR